MAYVAFYAPKLSEGEENPTKEFPTEAEARDYVFSNMCSLCQKERQEALQDDNKGDLYPACACEWFVLTKEEFEASESFEDILDASGYDEVIYRRPNK